MGRRAREVLTVDPGLGGTGWCYWRKLQPKNPAPFKHGVITPRQDAGWQARASWIVGEFIDVMDDLRIGSRCAIVIEWPKLWVGSAKSMAAGEDGDLFKLTYVIGALATRAALATGNETVLLPVSWKGQLPKKEILRRLKTAMGISFKDHEGDAAGMGLYLLGKLNA